MSLDYDALATGLERREREKGKEKKGKKKHKQTRREKILANRKKKKSGAV